ncbi:MAG: hydrogenase maturation protease [Anaerolineales bacterium]|jgi:hydrogenase maturation protease
MNITLVGIGQPLRGDDGVGPEAVRQWSHDQPRTASDPNIKTIIIETPGLELLELIQDSDVVILVDAVDGGDPAGTVRVRTALPEANFTPAEKTAHGFGVAETVALAKKIGACLPSHIIFIGVEGSKWKLGEDLSDPVRRAVPDAVREIQNQIERWSSG